MPFLIQAIVNIYQTDATGIPIAGSQMLTGMLPIVPASASLADITALLAAVQATQAARIMGAINALNNPT